MRGTNSLNGAVSVSALAQQINTYRGDLKRSIAPLLVRAFHEALHDGAGDEILDSLRPSFEEAAAKIEEARGLINAEAPAEQFLASASPAAVAAWQSLDTHLATITAIASIAAQFGCCLGQFPLIEEFSLGDNFRLDDRAIWCCDGPSLEGDSKPFGRPYSGHRTSPWFRTPLRLHTVDSARDRYRQWASSEWERLHSGPGVQYLGEDRQMHDMPKQVNHYAAVDLARG